MYRIYRYAITLAASLMSVAALAQNLDPTVEVSRAYEGTLVEVHKPTQVMAVPDSVQRFRLDFDYSVFDKPYKGSYEFSPYMTSMRPASSAFKPNVFYLRAGAGYRLYPVADLIWSPAFKKGFKMDVYASHSSYVGDYRTIKPLSNVLSPDGNWKGYDLKTDAGVSGRYDWEKGVFDFDASYLGIHSKEVEQLRGMNGLDASFGVASKAARTFMYEVDLDYRFVGHKTSYNPVQEHFMSFNADLGPQFKTVHKILFGMGVDMTQYAGNLDWGMARMDVTPHYVYQKGRWTVDAGVKVDFLVASIDAETSIGARRQQVFYPDVHVEFEAVRNAMNLYVSALGGNQLNTYSDMVFRNHFADQSYLASGALDATVERVKATLGMKGRIGTKFSYDLNGGYAGYGNMLLDGVAVTDAKLHTIVGYSGCSKAFAELEWLLDTERFKFDGNLQYAHYWGFETVAGLFAPSAFTGSTSMEYNIRKRIYFGVDCDFATGRKMIAPVAESQSYSIPGYADLGLSVEVLTSRKLSFWARGGNLLNMTIQRVPLYAEGGINFTVGLCVNL